MSANATTAVWNDVPRAMLERFYVDGEWRKPLSGARNELISQVSEEVLLSLPAGSERDVDAAVAAARRAFDAGPWPRLSFAERGGHLKKIAAELRERVDLSARLHTAQVSAPVSYARGAVEHAAAVFDFYGDLGTRLADGQDRELAWGKAKVFEEPVGVAAIITPWNAPIVLMSFSVAAALLAGCTIVSKPSPESPLDALLVAHCAQAAGLPGGVLNVVPAGRDVGAYLTRHRDVDKISFTGSTAAARNVAEAGLDRLTRLTLELGGKSAAIVMDDADVAAAMQAIVPLSMPFAGQICFALTRILVPESRAEEILESYVGAVKGFTLGDPWDPSTIMGPVVSQVQMDRILNYIRLGREDGARLVTGGGRAERFGRGYFIEPTVFANVDPAAVIAQEEIFGPVVSVITYKDEDDAIRIANGTKYGLTGAVFTADNERGIALARRVRAGSVNVNTFNIQADAPSGGVKQSGNGRVGGIEGLRAYQETKTVYLPG